MINGSGTEIIKELGEMHMKTGAIIVYTSADSVLQVAAHEDIIPLEELYSICEKISFIGGGFYYVCCTCDLMRSETGKAGV